jgi:hypothetical protein
LKPKPYDTTPSPSSTAEEPALAYATSSTDYRTSIADETMPFVITKSGEKWYDTDLETAEELEKILMEIENGTMEFYTAEEVHKEMKEYLAELNRASNV